MFKDKLYLKNLKEDKDFTDFPDPLITEYVDSGLHFLDTRIAFWRQQNPLYARKKVTKKNHHVVVTAASAAHAATTSAGGHGHGTSASANGHATALASANGHASTTVHGGSTVHGVRSSSGQPGRNSVIGIM